jgi:hypothetical protein
VPSTAVLAAIAQVYELEVTELIALFAPPSPPATHVLLYQAGARRLSPARAVQELFDDRVDLWLEFGQSRTSRQAPSKGTRVRRMRGQLANRHSGVVRFEPRHALDVVSRTLREASAPTSSQLGIVFGASSSLLREVENPEVLLESEATWGDDVAAASRAALGFESVASVCVYFEGDLRKLGDRIDPLAAALHLIRSHPTVAAQDEGGVTTGAVAIETILAGAQPGGISEATWQSLAHAAAVGLERRK